MLHDADTISSAVSLPLTHNAGEVREIQRSTESKSGSYEKQLGLSNCLSYPPYQTSPWYLILSPLSSF